MSSTSVPADIIKQMLDCLLEAQIKLSSHRRTSTSQQSLPVPSNYLGKIWQALSSSKHSSISSLYQGMAMAAHCFKQHLGSRAPFWVTLPPETSCHVGCEAKLFRENFCGSWNILTLKEALFIHQRLWVSYLTAFFLVVIFGIQNEVAVPNWQHVFRLIKIHWEERQARNVRGQIDWASRFFCSM